MPNASSWNDTFSINGVNAGTFFDYNLTNWLAITLSKNTYLSSWNLYIGSANYLYYGSYWKQKNALFSNWLWWFTFNLNEWSNLVEINNGWISITNWWYSASYSGPYGYLSWWGNGTNSGSTGTQIWSLLCWNRIKCTEIDCFSWKHIKNIHNEENNINYNEIKWEFLNLKFNEYNFKKENNLSQIGLIAEQVNENNYFQRFVNNNIQCDYENILLKCKCKFIENNIFEIITNEILDLENIKIKIFIINESRVVYTTINNMKIIIEDYKNNDEFDIIILWWELNIPSINKSALFETWMFILKNHLIEYENDKKIIMNKLWEPIINNSLSNNQYEELKCEIQDFQQWFQIMNKRTLNKTESQQKLNICYDEITKQNEILKKNIDLLFNMNIELKNNYNNLLNNHNNLQWDFNKLYDIVMWKDKKLKWWININAKLNKK